MYINQNISAMNAQRHVFDTNRLLDQSIERLSSGLRINSAADDASGVAIVGKMAAQTAGLTVAAQNAQDGQALFKTAEGALAQVGKMLARMEELAVRATNGTLTASDRAAVTAEVLELRDEINKIATNTEYNTLKLLNGGMNVSSSINVTGGNPDVVRVVRTSPYMKDGEYDFALTSAATAARVAGGVAGATASESGTISVNGIEISIASGDDASAVKGKINAQNGSHEVIAAVTSDDRLILVSGILDGDAANVDNLSADVLGFALLGSAYTVSLDGNSTILGDFGIADKASGTNAAGTIDGTPLTVAGGRGGGTRLRDANLHSATFGLELATDQYNGIGGTYVYDGQADADGTVVYRGADGDAATVSVDTGRRMRLQIGANYDQAAFHAAGNITSSALGIGGSAKFGNLAAISMETSDDANVSLKVIQKAIEDVASVRATIGASMNRLDYTIRSLGIQRENMMAAQSRIEDADISLEMTLFTKHQIMLQVGTAMLAQANTRAQTVQQLLQ